ncbi:unnamed protein product, partial [Amoebophrya sp. A25]|eukprot:GSA25T00011319001.1
MQDPDTEPPPGNEYDAVVANLVTAALRDADQLLALLDQKVPPRETRAEHPPSWGKIQRGCDKVYQKT